MSVDRPLPVLDLSARGFLACVATASNQHVGDFAPEDRPRARWSAEQREWAARVDAACLFCRSSAPSGGEEHIMSVALGNWFWTLPPNVVCNTCNNGVLSVLDTALQKHPFIAMVRTLANIRGRSGQPSKFGASNVQVARDVDGGLTITADHQRHVSRTEDEIRLRPKWVNHGPRQRRDTARALLKLGLGVIWLARGPDETDSTKYDHVRDAIRGDKRIPLQHGFDNAALPSHAICAMAVSHKDATSLRVTLDYLGVRVWAATEGTCEQASSEFLADAV